MIPRGDSKWNSDPGKGMGSYYLMGTEFRFGMMRTFWRWMVVV